MGRKEQREKAALRAGREALGIERQNLELRQRIDDMGIEHAEELARRDAELRRQQRTHQAQIIQIGLDDRRTEDEIRSHANELIQQVNDANAELAQRFETQRLRIAELEAHMPDYDKLHSRLRTKTETIQQLQRKINGLLKDINQM